MALEGLQAVQVRIAAIQARVGVFSAPARTASAAAPALFGADQFDKVYSAALGSPDRGSSAPAAGLRPAKVMPAGRYGRLEPPSELVGFGNGRIPPEALTPIGRGSHRLYAPAAQAFRQMEADAAAAGITFGVTDSYRTYESQVDLARRKGLHSHGGLAARPGTSNHGWGLSLDLDLDPAAQKWMRDNGWRYGFVEDVPREPWHWTYRPAS